MYAFNTTRKRVERRDFLESNFSYKGLTKQSKICKKCFNILAQLTSQLQKNIVAQSAQQEPNQSIP